MDNPTPPDFDQVLKDVIDDMRLDCNLIAQLNTQDERLSKAADLGKKLANSQRLLHKAHAEDSKGVVRVARLRNGIDLLNTLFMEAISGTLDKG